MPDQSGEPPGGPQVVLYETDDGKSRIRVRLAEGTVWLTQALLAELFQTSVPNINIHIRNILADGELLGSAVVKEYSTTAADGERYRTKDYGLEMILAVGCRVRSSRGTQFRQWATGRLGEYLVKGIRVNLMRNGVFPDMLDPDRGQCPSESRLQAEANPGASAPGVGHCRGQGTVDPPRAR